MRTTKTLLARAAAVLLLAALCPTMAWAEDSKIIVWLNNGTKTEVLFNEMPEFVYQDGTVSLKSDKTELSWPLASLEKFTFEASESDITGISNLPAGKRLDLAKGGTAYDLSGRLVKKDVKSLSELPVGVYIVDDGSVTTKVIRK